MGFSKDFVVNIMGDSSGVDKVFGAFEKNAGKIALGAAAAFAGAKLGDAFISSLDAGAVQSKMSASLNLTKEESGRIGGAAGKLFADNYGDSMEQTTGAVESVIGSFDGLRTASEADIESMTAKVLNFSKTFEVDVTRASQVAGQMITQGLAVDGSNAMDLLTASMQKVPVAVRGDLLDAVDEYGGYFNQLGMSGDKAMSMLVAGSAKGMFGIDKTGDALKEFTLRSTDMSSSSVAAYQSLGLGAQDMSNQILAGGDLASGAFDKIVSGVLAIPDPTTRANTALALFGTPLEDLGTDQIPAFLTSLQGVAGGLGEVSGATDAMGVTLNDNTKNKVDTMKRGVDAWTQSLVSTPGALGDVTAGLMAFGPGTVAVLGAVGPLVMMTAARIGNTAATTVGTVANTGFAASMWATVLPLLAVVAAVVLLAAGAYLIISNWGTIGPWLGELWDGAWKGVSWFIGVVSDGFMKFTPLGFIISNFGAITDWFGGFFGGIGGMVTDWVGFTSDKIGQLVGFFTDIPTNVGKAWTGMGDMVRVVMHNIAVFAADTWNNTLGSLNFDLPWYLGGAHISFGKLNVPALADGGIVSSPTLALIGEAGPEAVVPLSQYRGSHNDGTSEVIEIHLENKLDGGVLSRSIHRYDSKKR